MKIASWNVNGLRSVHSKGLQNWVETYTPDIVCLQEIKIDEGAIPEELRSPYGYRPYWHCGTKKGYCGVATWSRMEPLRVRHGIGVEEIDREGRVLITDYPEFTLVNTYFPNSQRDHARLGFKLKFCQIMLQFLENERSEGRRPVVCGDINIAHREIDLRNPKQNQKNAGFLPEERAWMDELLGHGYIDCFRKFVEEGGHYTWWSYRPTIRERNIGWRLDYFLAAPELDPHIKGMTHQTEVLGSDHCPVVLQLGF